jgi:hypothetical protein
MQVVVVYDPGDVLDTRAGVTIYRDGTRRQGPGDSPGVLYSNAEFLVTPSNGGSPLRFGTRDPNLIRNSFFTGGLDEVAVFDRKLAVSEIQLLYDAAVLAVTPVNPAIFRLMPVSNPSSGQVFFTLELDRDAAVNVQIFGIAGRRVTGLLNAWVPAGSHPLHWTGLDRSGSRVPPGVYIVRAKAGARISTARVVLLR